MNFELQNTVDEYGEYCLRIAYLTTKDWGFAEEVVQVVFHQNELDGISNPLEDLNTLFVDKRVSNQIFLLFFILIIGVTINHIYFKIKFKVRFTQKLFEDNKYNSIVNVTITLFMIIYFWNLFYEWATFIPLLLALFISSYLWLVHRFQSKTYFIRECISIALFTPFIIYFTFL